MHGCDSTHSDRVYGLRGAASARATLAQSNPTAMPWVIVHYQETPLLNSRILCLKHHFGDSFMKNAVKLAALTVCIGQVRLRRRYVAVNLAAFETLVASRRRG